MLEEKLPISRVARDLGPTWKTLDNWVKFHKAQNGGEQSEALTLTEKEELRRLSRENKILREERAIIKSRDLLRKEVSVSERFRFIDAEKVNHSVSILGRA